MAHITFIALPRCLMSGIVFSIDTFSIANRWADPKSLNVGAPLFRWDVATLDGRPVAGEGRVLLQPNCSIHEITRTDFIFLPGMLLPLSVKSDLPDGLIEWLWRQRRNNTMIGSSCTGTFLLAEAGLLDGKAATTNWAFTRRFKKSYPNVRLQADRILTEDDGILCAGATTSIIDLCLYLIKKFGSEELAAVCSKVLLMSPVRRSQTPFEIFNYRKNHSDEAVLKAQERMEMKYAGSITVDGLASDSGVSTRHFIRRFKAATGDSPLQYLQRIRVEIAKSRLEKTRESVEEITLKVGYENANSFRKLFKKNTGLSPREYRMQFGGTRMTP